MSRGRASLRQTFSIQGQFLGFIPNPKHPFKYLRLAGPKGEVEIKLKKWVQLEVIQNFAIGDWIELTGEISEKSLGSPVLKAHHAQAVSTVKPLPTAKLPFDASVRSEQSPVSIKILVCSKSSCLKRGSTEICQVLESLIETQGLSDRVQLKKTGCIDRCKQGPNLIFMPAKSRHSNIQAGDIPQLLQAQLTSSFVPPKSACD
jgi:(2Fe-2S) ferredoxin